MTTKVSTTVEWTLLAVTIKHHSRNQVIKVLKQVYIVIIHTTTSVRVDPVAGKGWDTNRLS